MSKTALVISGGGSKGAFAVGVLQYIHAHVRPIDGFDLYCGTSTGSLICPLAALGDLDLLTTMYTTTNQDDVLNLGPISNLLTDVSLHDASPLKDLINRQITDARFQSLTASGKAVYLSTVCLQTEKLVFFTTRPTPSTEDYETIQLDSRADLQRAMLASACQPVFMQPVEVQPGRLPIRQYSDGGVREVTPLQIAVDNGATTIIAISLGPSKVISQDDKFSSAFRILERTIDMFGEDVGHNDYRIPRLYRDANLYLANVRKTLLARGVSLATIDTAFARPDNPFVGKPLVKIHEIRPDQTLLEGGPGGLIFNSGRMQAMLAKGVAKAKRYFEQLPAGL
jgi:NTE family protein